MVAKVDEDEIRPPPSENAWTDGYQNLKIGRGDYVTDIYPVQNCIAIRLGDFAPRICEDAYKMFTRLVFYIFFWGGIFQLAALGHAAPILTINTSKDVVSRKDVPFGGPEN